jgi:MFS family permease
MGRLARPLYGKGIVSIYLIALMAFVLFLSTQVGVPVLPALSAQLGADETRMAAILSAAMMTLVAVQLFSGAIADRWGKRRVLAMGAAVGGVSSLLCAIAPSWQALLGLRVLGGLADAVVLPALLGLTAEIAKGRKGAFFGVLRSSQGLSFIVAPAIGGWLGLASLRLPFIADGLLSLAACLILYTQVRDGSRSPEAHRTPWRELALLRERRVYAFALFGLVNTLAFPVLSVFLPTKAQGLGFSPWQISLLLMSEAVTFTVTCALIGPWSDRLGRKPFVIAAQPLLLIACLGLAATRALPALAAFYALFGVASASTFLLSLAMMADVTPAAQAATRLGAFDALVDMGILAGPALAIGLQQATGRMDWVILAAGVPALLAFPVALFVKETRRA